MNTNLKKILPWSFATAAVITAISWLILGIYSPLNHGTPPDVHDKPLILPFVLANLPAGIVFVNVFSKLGPEWGYFICIFIQWLSIIAVFGMVKAVRKQNSN